MFYSSALMGYGPEYDPDSPVEYGELDSPVPVGPVVPADPTSYSPAPPLDPPDLSLFGGLSIHSPEVPTETDLAMYAAPGEIQVWTCHGMMGNRMAVFHRTVGSDTAYRVVVAFGTALGLRGVEITYAHAVGGAAEALSGWRILWS